MIYRITTLRNSLQTAIRNEIKYYVKHKVKRIGRKYKTNDLIEFENGSAWCLLFQKKSGIKIGIFKLLQLEEWDMDS